MGGAIANPDDMIWYDTHGTYKERRDDHQPGAGDRLIPM